MTTYLDLVNKVLPRLRHDPVTDLSETYSLMVGSFVNQAKEDVEDEGPWQALRATKTITCIASTATYLLAATNERSYVFRDGQGRTQAFETTAGNQREFTVITPEEMRRLKATDQNPSNSRPQYLAVTKGNDGLTATVYPTPDDAYTFSVVVVTPQEELTDGADVLTIPARPVWMLALAYALKERGEELGSDYMTVRGEADRALRNAILSDYGAEPSVFYAD